jgi:hypothetical protein
MMKKVQRYNGEDGSSVSDEDSSAKSKPQSFKEAFAAARSGGDKTFSWNGKSYTTELASSKSSYSPPSNKFGQPGGSISDADSGRDKAQDETKMSVTDRARMSRERARQGSGPTDTRSVSERIKSSLGFKKGGSVPSASRRGDGIAQRGKTKGKMC